MPGLSCGMQDLLVAKYGLSAAACGIQFLDQGSNSSPLHWKHGVLAMGTLGKSKMYFLKRAAEEVLRQTHRAENKVQTGAGREGVARTGRKKDLAFTPDQ